jgi:hypothetical protein
LAELKILIMLNSRYLVGLLSLFCCMDTAYSQKLKVELKGTKVFKFTSAIDSQQYVLHVHLPYDSIKPNKTYPVLYVTDGQWFFPHLYSGYGSLHYDGFVEMIFPDAKMIAKKVD